ncbi:MAG TPA: DEAD/DEAH box helicase family protein, partial [Caldilineaceae bacterium]|nr:DEAD/DEAH box helicase family protein [Caldilineaceae bacterium]
MSNFTFLKTDEWQEIYTTAQRAERYARCDPRAALFYGRRAAELLVNWLYDFDPAYTRPYDDGLNALLRHISVQRNVPIAVQNKLDLIRKEGNLAVHDRRQVAPATAMGVIKELFHVAHWFARTYTKRDPHTIPDTFDENAVPVSDRQLARYSITKFKELDAKHQQQDEELRKERAESARLREQLAAMQQQVAQQKAANQAIPDPHDYSEAETRERLIDVYLREAGWDPYGERVRELPVQPMPNPSNMGYADYVLWGDDGLPLAVVEAKRASVSLEKGKQQAKLYADALEAMYGRRPLIFYTNGYAIELWDDTHYPPRRIQGFYTKDQLELLIQRRKSAAHLPAVPTNSTIVDRHYQEEAIRRVAEHLQARYRKALLVMATGTGKTRTIIALIDLLMRANWVKRVLFLADRKTLVRQAVKAFKAHLPAGNPVNLLEEKEAQESRIVVSTYHTIMNLIDDVAAGDRKRFGVGHFDLIIIDEAHRSVYQKFGAIFDYFDGLLIGLTATPKDEVDRNTYGLFDLENGVPTFAYDLDQAIGDGYLVWPTPKQVPVKFLRQGIRYDDLTEAEQEEWDLLEWNEEGEPPDKVDAAELNRWLFNEDTVNKVLRALMEHGLKVAGGDRLGKTIIFAKNRFHAEFIEKQFNKNYPHYQGHFARIIEHETKYVDTIIDDFGKAQSAPHIAISIDMLDTGVDVPEVVNLVFFKPVRSKTKFFQMIGRGTRLCPDLFGPDEDKACFYIFDCCSNFEFFNYSPNGIEGKVQLPLRQRIFTERLNLLYALNPIKHTDDGLAALATDLADSLHAYVAAMPLENFLVRPNRQYVDPFMNRARWEKLTRGDVSDLTRHVAGLPSQLPDDPEPAKRFDLQILQLQAALLEEKAAIIRNARNRIMTIAHQLQEKSEIPAVRNQLDLLQAVQTEVYWENLSLPGLERLRLALRDLVQHIDRKERKALITNFTDEIGLIQEAKVPYLTGGVDVAQYRKKVEQFLRSHQDHMVIHKLRRAQPLTSLDLSELERFFFEAADVGTRAEFEAAFPAVPSLSAFIRGLVGLDRRAAKERFARYLDDQSCSPD